MEKIPDKAPNQNQDKIKKKKYEERWNQGLRVKLRSRPRTTLKANSPNGGGGSD
jgi:hypothetical protein